MVSVKRNTPTHPPPSKGGRTAGAQTSARAKSPLVDNEPAEQTQLDEGTSRVVERPDGFYWQDEFSAKLYGPFPTLTDAMQDMQYREDSDYEEGESLQEAEAEIGIADWVDPETGELAEGFTPHRGSD